MKTSRLITFLFGMALILTSCKSSEKNADEAGSSSGPRNWNQKMLAMQEGLTRLEPIALDSRRFADKKNAIWVEKEITELVTAAKELESDPTLVGRDPTVRFIATQFTQELEQAKTSFARKHYSFARYRLLKMTSFCVECHTRMSQGPEVHLGSSDAFVRQLPLVEQAEYLIASRRFQDAEKLINSELNKKGGNGSVSATDWDRFVQLGLQISVQHKEDSRSTERLMLAIQNSGRVPYSLKRELPKWKLSIERWKANPKTSFTLPELKSLVENSNSVIDAMRAIPQLLRFQYQDLSTQDRADAMLLTGMAYEKINPISPLSLHENYYRSCVQTFPKSSVAKKCFDQFEKSITLGYTGSRGTELPVEVQVDLDNLRRLLE